MITRRILPTAATFITGALLTGAGISPLTAQDAITVGRNVQVSAGHPAATHYEVIVAADAGDPARMVVGSFLYPPQGGPASTIVYTSRDGGASWTPTLEGEALWYTSDPAPAYGPDGTAYYTASSLGPSGTPRPGRRMLMYRSPDGGDTWDGPFPFTYSDRQYVTVDATGGEYHGRVYVNGNNRVPYGISDFVVFTSTDGGHSFEGPGTREGFGSFGASIMGNAVVASDGTLIGIFIDDDRVESIASTDGGASLEPAITIDDGFVRPGNRKGARNNVMAMPIMAIDGGSAAFQDRLYAVWGDRRTGRSRIFFSWSADMGATWSPARPIDDSPPEPATDPFMPTVAVNDDGVVGVLWYDRRNHPDNLGWDVRFAASVDGGESFLPSIEVSEHGTTFRDDTPWTGLQTSVSAADEEEAGIDIGISLNSFIFMGGDTAGLVADAAGVFHPVWVDNRTGVPQVWTAPVRIGRDVPAGQPAAADDGADVTERVTLEIVEKFYDRSSETLTAVVRLRNTSAEELIGPFRVRVAELGSGLGEISVAGGGDGGGEWWFAEERLAAGAESEPRTWRFELTDVRPYRSGDRYERALLRLKVTVMGEAAPNGPSTRER